MKELKLKAEKELKLYEEEQMMDPVESDRLKEEGNKLFNSNDFPNALKT